MALPPLADLVLTWNVASGAALILLGVVSLSGGRARPRGGLAFGLFAVLWGVHIILVNAASVSRTADETARILRLSAVAFLLPLSFLLIEFGASQLDARKRLVWDLQRALALAAALAVSAAFVVAPSSIFQGMAVGSDGYVHTTWGPLYVPLVIFPFFGSFVVALLALAIATYGSPTLRTTSRAGTLLAGIGIYAAYAASSNFVFYAGDSFLSGLTTEKTALSILFLGLCIACVVVAFAVWNGGVAEKASKLERRSRLLLSLAFVIPMLWGAVEAGLALTLFPRLETGGIWRIAGVAVVAYSIVQWRFVGLPTRVHRAAATSVGAAGGLAGGVAAYQLGTVVLPGAVVPPIVALIGFGLALFPSLRVAKKILGPPAEERALAHERQYGERVESYRAAVEASLARGSLEEDEPFLGELRKRVGLSIDEERLLRHLAKSTMLFPRKSDSIGAYERLRLLAEGGGGRTWLARDRAREVPVVLKEPLASWQTDDELRESVLREARLAARVSHPNVVRVREVLEIDGLPLIVMDYAEGGSLEDLLQQRGTLNVHEFGPLMLDVLAGLEAVHRAGMIHRDVKPANILLSGEGRALIADFGISARVARGTVIIEGDTARSGTRRYMAPEVVAGTSVGDHRSDIYSAAAVAYECLYGSPPAGVVLQRDDVPVSLSKVVARGLAPQKSDRFQSAATFAKALEDALHAK